MEENIHLKKNKKQTFRSMRTEESVKNYLNGKSRKAYTLREDIARGLKEAGADDAPSCLCRETLEKYKDQFNNMIHTGPSLVKRASEKKSSKKYKDLSLILKIGICGGVLYISLITIGFIIGFIFAFLV